MTSGLAETCDANSVSVTVYDVAGKLVFGPGCFDGETAVCKLRQRLLSLQPAREPDFPWKPDVRTTIELEKNGQALLDDHVLSGSAAELTMIVVEKEFQRDGLQLEDVIGRIEEHIGKCRGLFVHGSWLYSYKPADDIDLFAVVEPRAPIRPFQGGTLDNEAGNLMGLDTCFGRVQVALLDIEDFFTKLQAMDLTVWTFLSVPECFVLKPLLDERLKSAVINRTLLKEAVLAFADYKYLSAVMAGFRREDCCKLIYYAFRALELGRQLIVHGRIVDFKAGNVWYERARQFFQALCAAIADWVASSYSKDSQDVVQALFARSFQQEAHAFCIAADERVGAESQSTTSANVTGGLCDKPLQGEHGDATCSLLCGHEFLVADIASSIRKQFLAEVRFRWNEDRYAYDKVHPEAICPSCAQSVRLLLNDSRLANRLLLVNSQALPGANAALLILYDETINFHQHDIYLANWATALTTGDIDKTMATMSDEQLAAMATGAGLLCKSSWLTKLSFDHRQSLQHRICETMAGKERAKLYYRFTQASVDELSKLDKHKIAGTTVVAGKLVTAEQVAKMRKSGMRLDDMVEEGLLTVVWLSALEAEEL
eukprot:TRINITY_DN73632_c0_g1_i1.p1 TRINITY_DN73632_c0_g1~~TRINITY_DN73632_c0_g1_i1.p1  ORF type:complete len:599 (+),score=72.67 TRINITY_DN73632_c0_g1_i1:76-1872(+)